MMSEKLITKKDIESLVIAKETYDDLNLKIADRMKDIIELIGRNISGYDTPLASFYFSDASFGEVGDFLNCISGYLVSGYMVEGVKVDKYRLPYDGANDYYYTMPLSFITMTDEDIIKYLCEEMKTLRAEEEEKVKKRYERKIEKAQKHAVLLSKKEKALAKLTREERDLLNL